MRFAENWQASDKNPKDHALIFEVYPSDETNSLFY